MKPLTMSRVWPEPARLMLCLVLLLWAASAWALEVPALTGRVVDPSHLLPAATVESLTASLAAHEAKTSNQVAVLILPSLEGEPFEPFSHQVATTWKLGQKGTDNGALLLVALKERKVRIEVGYGLEGTLTDARSAQIIRNEIVPRFRAGDLPGGITVGVEAILNTIEGTYQAPERPSVPAGGDTTMVGQILVALLIGVVFGLALSNVNRVVGALAGTGLALWLSPWLIPAIVTGLVTLLLVLLLGTAMSGRGGRGFDDWTSYSSRGGGWGGGGFGGGGGFSGGGGDFGGGGASGDW